MITMKGARRKKKAQLVVREGFYFMEVCDQVQSINIVLREKDIPLHVFVERRRISTQSYNGIVTVYLLTLEVDPTSCTDLRYKTQEGLIMRLHIRSMEEVPPGEVPTSALAERISDAFETLNGNPCSCGCRTCGINLLKQDVKFTRVFRLPSESLMNLSSSWTCCRDPKKDGTRSNPGRSKTDHYPFVPRFREILENEFFIIFYPTAVARNNIVLHHKARSDATKDKRLKRHRKSTVKCARCYSAIGEALIMDKDTVRTYNFYKSSVEFQSFHNNFMQTIFGTSFLLERVLANQISNDVNLYTMHRFVLQDEQKKPYLLVQVLSAGARLRFHRPEYTEPSHHHGVPCCCLEYPPRYLGAEPWELSSLEVTKEDKEEALKDSRRMLDRALASMDTLYDRMSADGILAECEEKLVPPDIWSQYSFSPNCLTLRPTCDVLDADDDCGIERVVKVLYVSATTESGAKLAREWQKENDVRTITFPYSVCMDAILGLVCSTLSMPVRRIALDDFLFGFFRLE